MQEADGKVVIVTGASRGIGRALACRFVTEGARVAFCARQSAAVSDLESQLGENALGIQADIRHSNAAAALVDATLSRWGRIDVVINNAAVALDNYMTRFTDERWTEVIETNLNGPYWMMRAAIPTMKMQKKGSFVNILSYAGVRGNPGQASYAASKAGLYGLTITAAKELGQYGIRANGLSPSAETDMTANITQEAKTAALARRPLGRPSRMEEVEEAALFLAFDRSSFITGQVLHVDGGAHLY